MSGLVTRYGYLLENRQEKLLDSLLDETKVRKLEISRNLLEKVTAKDILMALKLDSWLVLVKFSLLETSL